MKILVADEQDLVRETVAAFLVAEGMQRVDTCATFAEVSEAMAAQWDIALIDAALPGLATLRALTGLAAAAPRTALVLLSASTSRDFAAAALAAGARGFLPKKMGARATVAALRRIGAGETVVPDQLLTDDPAPGAPAPLLTGRETTVLRGICEGKSNKEIARDLTLQEVTVKLHVKTLSRKLGARNRTHAAMIARNGGLV
ncbi:MAG TPA: response regulator transcription factor [Paracoccaceae bacterium]|nr:response regulator transcription factor [Paracoccaceae bacterium]HMO72179.1 response regulator transcription factor [Paracoccaceae bacterium]